jgi:Fic-DOC domain mobile mystery protein B
MAFDEPIPGQTPIDDISGLRDRSITTQAALNAAEAENIRKAVLKYLIGKPTKRSARFDLAWLQQLHTEMFGEVWDWAGSFRRAELNLGSKPHQIAIDLQTLIEDLGYWSKSDMSLLEQSVRLHHGAVRIHPFLNGNGRWSRMLGNIWLRMHGHPIVEWPENVIGTASEIRDDYLAAVRDADRHDFSALIALHDRYLSESD